jgi:hypothetical protein
MSLCAWRKFIGLPATVGRAAMPTMEDVEPDVNEKAAAGLRSATASTHYFPQECLATVDRTIAASR